MLTLVSNEQVVSDYLHWLEHRAKRRPITVRTYTYTLHSYLDWLGERSLSDVTYRDVEDFGARERRVDEPSAATVRRDVVIVRNFHQWAVERDYPLRLVSTAVAPSAPRPAPKPVDDDAWGQLWDAELYEPDRVWLGLGYFAGLRRIEIVTLRPRDVDLDQGTMRFVRKGGSPQSIEYREMFLVIDGKLPHLTMGRNWVDTFEDCVRDRQVLGANFIWWDSNGDTVNDANRLNKRCDRLTSDLGIPAGEVTPHRLRHSCATNLLRAGVDPAIIMNALSHSDMSITRRYMQTSGQLARWRAKGLGDG